MCDAAGVILQAQGSGGARVNRTGEWVRALTLIKRGPLAANDVLLQAPIARCAACQALLKYEDSITYLPLGPGPYDSERAKCKAGQGYAAVSVPVHWACATGETS